MKERAISTERPRVLLTGGAGFIGSHLAEALLAGGMRLTIVDSLDEFYSPAWKRANLEEIRHAGDFEFAEAGICDVDRMREFMRGAQFEVMIHLAARAGVRPSFEQPELYQRVNVEGTRNLLGLCREFGVRKFIFGSSSSVYGESKRVPFSEEQMDLEPISPYAGTKLAGEKLCRASAQSGLPVICLRFFTVYGPRQRPDLAIHKFTALIERGEPVPIFGDGGSGRDYTYVDDIVQGAMAAVEYEPRGTDGVPFEIFNLGNSHPVKLTELVETLERVLGKAARRTQLPPQAGDVPLTWADTSKAARLLGYAPKISFEEGLRRFVAWYRAADPARRA
jgi:UDP-glucuronate 4-epimerase